MFNAFAGAHLLDLERARKSWWVGLLFAALVLAVSPIAIMAAVQLDGAARIIVLALLAIFAFAVYSQGRLRIGDRLLARRTVAVVGKLLDKTNGTLADLERTLERSGFSDLARHLRSPYFAGLRRRTQNQSGPYR